MTLRAYGLWLWLSAAKPLPRLGHLALWCFMLDAFFSHLS